ncbi:MAG TPA: acetyl-CoA C-acetyltransferase [Actinomycetota bacterium]|nr:acetyl-CoA C-acetyltransferase [Actinomycetota bacterium]
MTTSVIVAGARTPIGKFGGGFRDVAAVDLGSAAIREAITRAGIQSDQVDYVILGQVLQGGAGQITARQAAIAAGIPKEVPSITINKVCLSGLNAVALADQLIRAGEIEIAVAGGMESMSNAPYVLPKARWGARMGHAELVDTMIYDGLWSTFTDKHMGESSDEVNAELGIGREEQDAWAARSHQRAAAAWDEGRMTEEVVPVEVPGRKGSVIVVDRDEGIRGETTAESLAALRPVFLDSGTISAGNASQISDGGAALIVMSPERAEALALEPLAEIVAHGMSAERYPYLHTVPALAMERALKKAGIGATDLGVVEINEAFAAVSLHASRMLGLDEAVVNPNGGAVALGHPIGMSGARLVLTSAYEMRRRGAEYAGATLCGGGGQGDALIIRNVS